MDPVGNSANVLGQTWGRCTAASGQEAACSYAIRSYREKRLIEELREAERSGPPFQSIRKDSTEAIDGPLSLQGKDGR